MRIPEGQKNLQKIECFGFGFFLTIIPALWAGDSAYWDLRIDLQCDFSLGSG
jgi:hypothetical protein